AREGMRAASSADARTRARANRKFHEALWEASHSPTLIDLLSRLNSYLLLASRTTLQDEQRWLDALKEHDALIDAISRHDTEDAKQLAEAHMIAARDVRLRDYAAAK